MRIRALVAIVAVVGAIVLGGCAIVPKNRRKYLADPTMQPDEDVLRDRAHAKIHTARFYFQRLLPRTRGLVPSMLSGAGNLMDLEDASFSF